MRISKLAYWASSVLVVSARAIPHEAHADAGENPANWVTFTKKLPDKTFVVEKYLGNEPLTGTQYTTKTFVAKYNGQEVTRVVTGHADSHVTEAAKANDEVNAAAKDPANWVTYTKDLGDRTIVVTRYLGKEPLVGEDYVTKTIVVSNEDHQYTELVTGYAAKPEVTADAGANPSNWVTYTKNLPHTTVVVEKYLGTEPLTGDQYTTKTFVAKYNDQEVTRVITGHADSHVTEAAKANDEVNAAAKDPANWVTYTKDLGDRTIVVTRYLGKEPLVGEDYVTKTIVVSNEDHQYTELVTGYAAKPEVTADAGANPSNWVTYTKNLPHTTVVVEKYLGTEPLTGTQYTTKTYVAKYNGEEVTGVVTGHADAQITEAPKANGEVNAAENPANWVTYTKDLGDRTIVVTRYLGKEPIHGEHYTTKTIIRMLQNGEAQFTELVTARVEAAPTPTQAAKEEDVHVPVPEPLVLQWVHRFIAWI